MLGQTDVFSTFASAGYFGETKLVPSLHQFKGPVHNPKACGHFGV